jgi:hypothetical protein
MGLRELAETEYKDGIPTWRKEIFERLKLWGGIGKVAYVADFEARVLTIDGLVFELPANHTRRPPSALWVCSLHEDGTSSSLGEICSLWELGEALL